MRVVGLGQPAAGDDGVGWAVAEALASAPPSGWKVERIADATLLVEWLDGRALVLVDAVAGLTPGELRWLDPSEVMAARAWSTHGVGLREAIGLAQALHGEQAAAGLQVLGIGIEPSPGPSFGLSEQVAGAIGPAVTAVRERCAALQEG